MIVSGRKTEARRNGIKAREALSPGERALFSAEICKRIESLPEYREASVIMVYRAVKAEADLSALAADAEACGKTVLYPRCMPESRMLALQPAGSGSWVKGSFGIPEPDPAKCRAADPSEIDLVICPCTAFDGSLGRTGMGGGYYDRFLPQCGKAAVIAAAFGCQKTASVPMEPYDVRMQAVVTEDHVYRQQMPDGENGGNLER